MDEEDMDPRVVADVFTDPNTASVLEVATGYFDEIVVVYATPDGELYAASGLVMSYYEFYWPQSDRLTDEEWRNMLTSGKAPPLPPWSKSYKAYALDLPVSFLLRSSTISSSLRA